MPDIRNFFGGGGFKASEEKTSKKAADNVSEAGSLKRKRQNARKVIDSDDEDEDFEASSKKTPQKKNTPSKRAKKESPKVEETTTSDYFNSNNKGKPAKPTPTKSRASVASRASPPTKSTPQKRVSKAAPVAQPPSGGRSSARKKKAPNYAEIQDDEEDEDAGGHGSHARQGKVSQKADDYHDDDEDEDDDDDDDDDDDNDFEAQPTKRTNGRSRKSDDVEMEDAPKSKGKINGTKSSKASVPKNAKRANLEEDDEDEDDLEILQIQQNEMKVRSPAKRPPKKKEKDKAEVHESKEISAIMNSIPTVRALTPPTSNGEPKKFNFASHASRTAPPPAAGTKDIPIGHENCLAGLTFVFTGLLETLGREEGQELVKRYGGRVTTAPSKATSFVVLGNDAGPKKLETIKKWALRTINEDGLFDLIRKLPANGGDSQAAQKNEEKKAKEAEKIREMAAEMEREDRRTGSAGGAGIGGNSLSTPSGSAKTEELDNRLWTTKYAPSMLNQICGNKGQVLKLQRWLHEWPNSEKINFKKAGADGTFCFRAVIIHGPPGIGKTTAAHLAAKLEGYDILESNASDTRSKKLVETNLKGTLDNTSLLGYFAKDHEKINASKKKLVLIMDEVDGMSAGDRGGVGALAAVCKKTHIPMILICNERRLPKMKPFDHVTYDLPFRRPTANDIRSRIASICFREKLKLPPQVIDALIEGSHADIRQIINMISQVKLDQEAMDFDQGKSMSKAWEKHVILKPWDIAHKMLSAAMFSPTSNKTLNDKIDLYFNDHEFSYLMIQENYLKTQPTQVSSYSGKERKLKTLELFDQAAESISDGDLVDRMIHGSQQQWSLMPVHAVFSTVRPASFIYGNLGGQASFTSWLGNNSKQGKLSRYVKEIQGHMRLRSSGDVHEIRQQYLPVLWTELVNKLVKEGKEAVPAVIELMDSYFLTKEDFDAIMELGLGPMDMEKVKIETQTKATFTRMYNQQSHPLPFMKASNVVAPSRAMKIKPDLEEAIDESDEGEEPLKEVKDEDEEDMDLSKDKYVRQPKKKAPAKSSAAKKAPAKKKGKVKEESEAESEDGSEPIPKPKKGKAKAAATKGKAKR